jgi:hypothetical protein
MAVSCFSSSFTEFSSTIIFCLLFCKIVYLSEICWSFSLRARREACSFSSKILSDSSFCYLYLSSISEKNLWFFSKISVNFDIRVWLVSGFWNVATGWGQDCGVCSWEFW